MEQKIEHFWPDRDELRGSGKLAPFGIKAIIFKQETQIRSARTKIQEELKANLSKLQGLPACTCASSLSPDQTLFGRKIEEIIMKIVLIGGTGLIGTKLAGILRCKGYEVLQASPSNGVDAVTGEGLSEALVGVDVVVDVANSPSSEDDEILAFFETSSRNILVAAAAANVRHHVALSIVGTDRLPECGYLRAKLAQEQLIERSTIPYSILRSTQFFEFVGGIIDTSTDGHITRLSPALIQPVASDDVAAALADVALADPVMDIVELAGPESLSLDEFGRKYLAAIGDPRRVVADIHARYFGVELDDRSLTPGNHPRLGAIRFEDWLATLRK
jgi:uncharacterized protein YbjT (DUF2867 family)